MKLSDIDRAIMKVAYHHGTVYPESMAIWRLVERLAERTGYLMENGNMDGFILTEMGKSYMDEN